MIFSYNWLQSFFKKKLPSPKTLAELLILHSFEVEGLEKKGKDSVLDVAVLPNRAGDCFSHMGIARECAVITKSKIQAPLVKIKEGRESVKDFVSVDVKNGEACPRYTARAVLNVNIGPSPKWLEERLTVCGLRPINNVVDIANYVMLETGQPLHAFDADKIAGKRIMVRFAKEKEKITTLDGQKFDLNSKVLVISDLEKPVAIAGIKGGKLPEVGKETRNIILEAANFNPVLIRKASRFLNLKTDASTRFEHGVDPNLAEFAINRAAYLIQETAKGKVAKGLIDVYSRKVFPRKIRLSLDFARGLLGTDIPLKTILSIFESLGIKAKETKKGVLEAIIPTIRQDISIPQDLVEEIGRIYGYEKIEPRFPAFSLVPPMKNLDIYWEDIAKNTLKEAGFAEAYNYSFFGEREAEIFGYKEELIEVENPVSIEQKYLRASLIPNLLKNIGNNVNYSKDIKLFELGKVFRNPKEEKRRLAGLIAGGSFYQLKGIIDFLLNSLGISNIWYEEYQAKEKKCVWNIQKCSQIRTDSEKIGILGELSKEIVESFGMKEKIVLFDIDFEKLAVLSSEEHEYRPISKFPAAVRDISLLVPLDVKVEDVFNVIEMSGGELVRDTDLFDIYEGEELPAGKKNLAFHIIFQSEEKTLKSKEIDELQDKIIKSLESNPGWQVRKS